MRIDLLGKWEEKRPRKGPVIFTSLDGQKIAIKDESSEPTGTYKDWHGWMMGLDYLRNHFREKFIYDVVSTGNAGMSDLYFADQLNKMLGEEMVKVVVFYPKHYDKKILGPDSKSRKTDGKVFRKEMEKYGGRVIRVDFDETVWDDIGDFNSAFDSCLTPCLAKMNEEGIPATPENSMDITEGFKPTYSQIMEDFGRQIIEQFGYFPKTLAIIQFGAGMLYDDSKEVAQRHKWPIDFLAVSTGDKDTIADKICDVSETWQESRADLLTHGYTFARNSGDRIYQVSDQEIHWAMEQFDIRGLESGPSGASGFAGIQKARQITKKKYDLIATIGTGNEIGRYANLV